MNKELLNFIEQLSQRDPKTLVAKTLKTTEENGELAKAVLAYTGADGSKHKFADKQKILEQVADTMLGAMSVAYNLDFTHEQIENMLYQKSNYWAKLQAKEKSNPFPIPFELHVTVAPEVELIDKFKRVCLELEVKPIILELINEDGSKVLDEVMTSSRFFGDNSGVQEELERIATKLKDEDFVVVRQKIETAPWHPAAPSGGLGKMNEGNYFEAHIDIKLKESEVAHLRQIAKEEGAIISHNNRKKFPEHQIYILTLRAYKGFSEEFTAKVTLLQEKLLAQGWEVERPSIEYSFYDSKVSHDEVWSKT